MKRFAVSYLDEAAGQLVLEIVEAEDGLQAAQSLGFMELKWFEGLETLEEMREAIEEFGLMVAVEEILESC